MGVQLSPHAGRDPAFPAWTGQASDAILRLVGQGEVADLVWEPPADLTAEHGQLCVSAIQARRSGRLEEGEHLWEPFTWPLT